jgi:hypothetical protein
MTVWHENDDLLRRQLLIGHEWACYAATSIEHRTRLTVDVSPFEMRENLADRRRFADEWDLTVNGPKGVRLEVKSRDLPFTGPGDFPHETAFVYSVRGWEAKTHRPAAVLLVSQQNGGIAVVKVSGAQDWYRRQIRDTVRGVTYDVFEVDRALLADLDGLCEWLLRRCGK